MDITLGKPYAISEKGGRINNEDSIYPQPEVSYLNHHLFIICDGVGGSEKGEIASSLACESIHTYFSAFGEGAPDKVFVNQSVKYTETQFDAYIKLHPSAKGMATTLAMAYVGSSGITLAHVGDSRIYQFRKGNIIHKTEDHSLVNMWVKMGQITQEEARVHPRRNVILRAIQDTEHSVEADVTLLTDIQPDDFIFICSDGVLERLSDQDLSHIFSLEISVEGLKNAVFEACTGKVKDNFSFYIIPIQNVLNSTGLKQNILSLLYSIV